MVSGRRRHFRSAAGIVSRNILQYPPVYYSFAFCCYPVEDIYLFIFFFTATRLMEEQGVTDSGTTVKGIDKEERKADYEEFKKKFFSFGLLGWGRHLHRCQLHHWHDFWVCLPKATHGMGGTFRNGSILARTRDVLLKPVLFEKLTA